VRRTAAQALVTRTDWAAPLRRLLDTGHDIEDNNGDGWTLLRHAVHTEHDHHIQTGEPLHADLTVFLLARGANPVHSFDGTTIVQDAQNRGHWLAAEIMHVWIQRSQATSTNTRTDLNGRNPRPARLQWQRDNLRWQRTTSERHRTYR
jgi:uncharacterized protein